MPILGLIKQKYQIQIAHAIMYILYLDLIGRTQLIKFVVINLRLI